MQVNPDAFSNVDEGSFSPQNPVFADVHALAGQALSLSKQADKTLSPQNVDGEQAAQVGTEKK